MIEPTSAVEDGERPRPRRSRTAASSSSGSSKSSSASTSGDDVLPHLGDKVVMFQSPTEGLSVFGTVVCVSLKDPAKIKSVADRINRGLEDDRQRADQGPEEDAAGRGDSRALLARLRHRHADLRFVDDWLVVSVHPQAVQGFILRSKGELEKWKPDAATAARLAKMPHDGCGLQFCRPGIHGAEPVLRRAARSSASCSLFGRFNQTESDFDPIDVGLIPNGHEVSKHLFPNLTVTRDDGKTIRIEVNESFSLPGSSSGWSRSLSFGTVFGFLNSAAPDSRCRLRSTLGGRMPPVRTWEPPHAPLPRRARSPRHDASRSARRLPAAGQTAAQSRDAEPARHAATAPRSPRRPTGRRSAGRNSRSCSSTTCTASTRRGPRR